eukprot:8157833-Prorocentrum_lima.AAC.1
MTSSLVGSEMCIRDSFGIAPRVYPHLNQSWRWANSFLADPEEPCRLIPVSYTHLTLPTICSV